MKSYLGILFMYSKLWLMKKLVANITWCLIFKLPILIPLSCLNFLIWRRIRLLVERWYDLCPQSALPERWIICHTNHICESFKLFVSHFQETSVHPHCFQPFGLVWWCWFEMCSDSSRCQFHWASLPSSKQKKTKKNHCFLVYDQTNDREGSDKEALVQH